MRVPGPSLPPKANAELGEAGLTPASPKRSGKSRARWSLGVALAGLLAACAATPVAAANPGYAPDAAHPSKALSGVPRGLAVDQASGDVYVAIVTTDPNTGAPGQVNRFNSSLTTKTIYAAGGGYYTGVAMNPAGGFFAAQAEIQGTPLGSVGTPRLDRFDSGGALAGSFAIPYSATLPPIVSNSAGDIFIPNIAMHMVQVYSSTGTLLDELTCGGCPGGAFGKPDSVALDSGGNLYVVDTNPDRLVKLEPSGGSYAYASTVQSGRGAGAVAVDAGNGDILVGDMPNGHDYHIVAYDSAGNQFDDFGAGMFPDAYPAEYGATAAYQMAIDGTTHEVYVGEYDKFYAFERVTSIAAPTVTSQLPSQITQLAGTMNATVDANGHTVLECEFEYTDEADFLVNGFSAATGVPCPTSPAGSGGVQLAKRLSGLTPGTAYRYRVTAANNGGSAVSGAEKLETLPELPPVVTTEAAQSVAQTTATLTAKVNPRGGTVTDCHFELGLSAGYGTSLPCPTSPGSGTVDVTEARGVSSLAPATTYHYRLVVTTNAGTTEGGDVAFTTASPPSETESPPSEGGAAPTAAPAPVSAPAPVVTAPAPKPARRCRKGFRRERIRGHARCMKVCRKGFRRKRVHRKVRCVRLKRVHRRRHRHRRRAPR